MEILARKWALWYEDNYKSGRLDGISKVWYENGNLKTELSYKAGEQNGYTKWWHPNGQLRVVEFYKDDRRVEEDSSISWHANGNVASKEICKETNCVYQEWHENGKLEEEGNYKYGKKEGIWKTWHNNGQLAGIRKFKSG